MLDNTYILISILITAFITFTLRALPFLYNKKDSDLSKSKLISVYLPAMIITILVIYSLTDTDAKNYPYGAPELICLVTTIAIHLYKKNALLSILLSTGLYIVIGNII